MTEPGSGVADLQALRDVVGDARVVALGESSHTAREQLQLKHRLLEFLTLEMDFTTLAFEESAPSCALLDRYIADGVGDLPELLSNLGLWEAWDTKEMLDLITWMHGTNTQCKPEQQLRFFGVDIGFPLLGIEEAFAYLDDVDPGAVAAFRERPYGTRLFSKTSWMQTAERYRRLSDRDREALAVNLARLVTLLEERRIDYMMRSSRARFEWAHRLALIATAAHAMYAAMADGEWTKAINIRDEVMAQNLLWILDVAEPGARVVLWAHNGHISKAPRTVPDPRFDGPIIPMGVHLAEALGDSLVTVGFTFDRGTDRVAGTDTTTELEQARAESLDGALAQFGVPAFAIDLRSAPGEGPVASWLRQRREIRYFADYEEIVPVESFDALVFIDAISPSRLNPLAVDRLAERKV